MATNNNFFSTKDDRNDFFIACVVIIVFGILIFKLLSSGHISENPTVEKTLLVSDTLQNNTQRTVLIINKKHDARVLPNSVSTSNHIAVSNQRDTSNFFLNEKAVDTSSLTIKPEIEDTLEPVNSKNKNIISVVSDTILSIDTSKTKRTTTVINSKNNRLQKTDVTLLKDADTIAQNHVVRSESKNDSIVNAITISDCTIVIGVYKKDINADRTILKLQKKGYAYTKQTVNGKRYVGVPVRCTNENEIKDLKQKLAKDLWIQSWVRKN